VQPRINTTGKGKTRVNPDAGVWVVPVLSWHHTSFDTEADINSISELLFFFFLSAWIVK
jgi:hypothetical protein